jgi:hypothetical protein
MNEASQSAAEMAALTEEARAEQLKSALHFQDERIAQVILSTMRKVLTEGDEGTKMLLIQKIPLLCRDLLLMKADLTWIKYLLLAVLGGVGTLAIAYLMK